MNALVKVGGGLVHDGQVSISTGKSRKETNWLVRDLKWSEFVGRLSRVVIGSETHEQYLAMPKDQQDNLKDVGGFVGGTVQGGRRVDGSVLTRSMFTGDMDYPPNDWEFRRECGLTYAHLVYSTRKHGPIKGNKLRLVVPFSRPCDLVEYEAVSRRICQVFGMSAWDSSTLEANRLMYFPSSSADVAPVFLFEDAPFIDVDAVLATYGDYRNKREWAAFDNENLALDKVKVAGDPCEKPGWIGAFCRTYGIHEVIDQFLGDVYRKGQSENRYTFTGGTSSNGARVYDNKFLYSEHDTDPARRRAVNAFDLVRIHKFGQHDEALDDFARLDVMGLPSTAKMLEMVKADAAVMAAYQAANEAEVERAKRLVNEAQSVSDVKGTVASEISTMRLDSMDREVLAKLVQDKLKNLTGVRVKIDDCRGLVKRKALEDSVAPDVPCPWWLDGIYYISNGDYFYKYRNGQKWSKQAFNMEFNAMAVQWVEEASGDEDEMDASRLVSRMGWVPVVSNVMYVPYFGETFELDGLKFVNSYRPDSVPEAQDMGAHAWECVEVFKEHLLVLFSHRVELRDLMIKWMAHQVQRPGEKVIWAWLIRGCQGDGKTMIRNMLGAAMGGSHVGEVSSDVLHGSFNSFVHGKCVNILEEIKASGRNRNEVMDKLKTPITNDRVSVHSKGIDAYDVLNTTNYAAFTNHRDALLISKDDRRWCVVFSPYMSVQELEKDLGKVEEYFQPMYDLYQKYPQHVRHWLLNVDISDFNPRSRAPHTEEREDMIEEGKSDDMLLVESLIGDKVCVSTAWLKRELAMQPVEVSNRRLPVLMDSLGFRRWYKSFKFAGGVALIYGKTVAPFDHERVRDYLLKTDQGVDSF